MIPITQEHLLYQFILHELVRSYHALDHDLPLIRKRLPQMGWTDSLEALDRLLLYINSFTEKRPLPDLKRVANQIVAAAYGEQKEEVRHGLNALGRILLQMADLFRDEHRVLLYLVQHAKSLNACLGQTTVEERLSQLHLGGLEEVYTRIQQGYGEAGYVHLLPFVQEKIEATQSGVE